MYSVHFHFRMYKNLSHPSKTVGVKWESQLSQPGWEKRCLTRLGQGGSNETIPIRVGEMGMSVIRRIHESVIGALEAVPPKTSRQVTRFECAVSNRQGKTGQKKSTRKEARKSAEAKARAGQLEDERGRQKEFRGILRKGVAGRGKCVTVNT